MVSDLRLIGRVQGSGLGDVYGFRDYAGQTPTLNSYTIKWNILPGQKVSVRILSVDVVAGKMMLTMKGEKKAADFNVTAFVDVPPQTWMSGKVAPRSAVDQLFGRFIKASRMVGAFSFRLRSRARVSRPLFVRRRACQDEIATVCK